MGVTLYAILIVVLAILDVTLLIVMMVFRQQSKNCNETYSPLCPLVVCADEDCPVVICPTGTTCPNYYCNGGGLADQVPG